MSTRDRLVLLDTATLYFRAFHAVPASVTAPDGTPSGAVRGTLDMLAVLLTRLQPTQVVACWDDAWRPAWRVALLPSYKAHRVDPDDPAGGELVPPTLGVQVDGVAALLGAFGIPVRGVADAEADDVAASLATRAASAGTPVVVVSGDRDLFQLVATGDGEGAPVRVVFIGRGVRDAEDVDAASLAMRVSLARAALSRPGGVGASYADLAVLRGDPSDGLPGVRGVGERTAAAMLNQYGSLEAILASAADPTSAVTEIQRRRLADSAEYLAVAPQVVAVRRDLEVDLPAAPPRGLRAAVDEDALAELAERWGVATQAGRMLSALAAADAAAGD